MQHRHPIYVVSKGRWQEDRRRTIESLLKMGNASFHVIVEGQEFDAYAAEIGPERLLVLPPSYLEGYDTFDDLGDSKGKGPGAARNFAWEHSIEQGATWHWVLDDNLDDFYRLHKNMKYRVYDSVFFRVMEDWADRWMNLAIAGPNYEKFIPRRSKCRPLSLNTRIYSCLLIRNDIPYRWRGRYNEDTDLCLRALKDGWCTAQFNAYLQGKRTTQHVKGGNTKEFYAKEGTLPKSEMLSRMHPDVSSVVWKFNRWHHEVDYKPFKGNRLVKRPGLDVGQGPNNYGMVFHDKQERIE